MDVQHAARRSEMKKLYPPTQAWKEQETKDTAKPVSAVEEEK
jgi:hypothetical protein